MQGTSKEEEKKKKNENKLDSKYNQDQQELSSSMSSLISFANLKD